MVSPLGKRILLNLFGRPKLTISELIALDMISLNGRITGSKRRLDTKEDCQGFERDLRFIYWRCLQSLIRKGFVKKNRVGKRIFYSLTGKGVALTEQFIKNPFWLLAPEIKWINHEGGT